MLPLAEKECRQLWDDIVRTGRDDKLVAHFVGSIVYVEKKLSNLTTQEPLLVIDGQQRLECNRRSGAGGQRAMARLGV